MNRSREMCALVLVGGMVLGACAGSSTEPAAAPDSVEQSSPSETARTSDQFGDFEPRPDLLTVSEMPPVDASTGMPQVPSMMADYVRTLAGDDAGLLGAADVIAAAERVALDNLGNDLSSGAGIDGIEPIVVAPSESTSSDTGPSDTGPSDTGVAEPQGFGGRRSNQPTQAPQPTSANFSTLGIVNSLLASLFGGVRPPKGVTVGGRSPTSTLQDGDGVKATGGAVIELSGEGEVTFGIDVELKVDQPADGDKAAVKGSAAVAFEATGDPCPAADGTVKVTFRAKLGADIAAGSKSAIGTSEVSGTAIAQVDDTATVTGFDIDARQQNTGTNAAGVGTFVDTAAGYRVSYADNGEGSSVLKPASLNRESQSVDFAERNRLHDDGMGKAANFVIGYLAGLEVRWKGGACVSVVATGPGRVSPGTRTPIAVSVVHKREGGQLALPVDATLSGTQSIDPARIAAAPGTVTHTASDAPKSVGSIEFVSTSRRGIGRVTVTITSGADSYVASGGSGVKFAGTIADLEAPFELSGQGVGFTVTFAFTPANATSGSLTYSGAGGPASMMGQGTYTIAGGDPDQLEMTLVTGGCVDIGKCKDNTDVVTLTRVAG